MLSFCFKVWGKVSVLFYYFHIRTVIFFNLIGIYRMVPIPNSFVFNAWSKFWILILGLFVLWILQLEICFSVYFYCYPMMFAIAQCYWYVIFCAVCSCLYNCQHIIAQFMLISISVWCFIGLEFVQVGLLEHIFQTMDLQQLKLLWRWHFVNFQLIMDLFWIVLRMQQMKDPLSLWLAPSVL